MINISLSKEEKKKLKRIRKSRKSLIRERVQYILLYNRGKSVKKIAKQFECHEHTVRKWLKAYMEGGIENLYDTPQPGRPNIKSKIVVDVIEKVMDFSPAEYGYVEEGWSSGILADYIKKEKGIDVHESTIKRVLKKNKFVYKRFSKTVPENAPSKEEKLNRIKEISDEIKDIEKEEEVEILFADESHFNQQPYVQRGWFRIGEKKSPNISK